MYKNYLVSFTNSKGNKQTCTQLAPSKNIAETTVWEIFEKEQPDINEYKATLMKAAYFTKKWQN